MPPVLIRPVVTASELAATRELLRAFLTWHRSTHAADAVLLEEYFKKEKWEYELEHLTEVYAPPGGVIVLATIEGEPAGCGALRRIDESSGELKRIFVPEPYRGRGVGLALCESLIGAARSFGYDTLRLDTSIRQSAAQRLYERLGFKRIDPYYTASPDLLAWMVFMELRL